MDIPFELWNETSAEVADLKKQVCVRSQNVILLVCKMDL